MGKISRSNKQELVFVAEAVRSGYQKVVQVQNGSRLRKNIDWTLLERACEGRLAKVCAGASRRQIDMQRQARGLKGETCEE